MESPTEYTGAIDRGLEGVVACTTGISTISGSTLLYRGYTIEDLAASSHFEEVGYLLSHARVTSSHLSGIYSSIMAAIGTLKGPLHGGANEQVMRMLLEIGSPEHVEAWIDDALAAKRKVMGFGHRVYKGGDPRARILRGMSE